MRRYPQLEKGTLHAKVVVLQREGTNRFMDLGNKVSGFAHVPVSSNQLSPTQQMVLCAVTGLGLNADTASVFSLGSDPEAPRQRTYALPKT